MKSARLSRAFQHKRGGNFSGKQGRLIRARPQLKVPLKLWLKRLCRFMERFAARRALAYYVNLNFIAVLLYATAILNK